MINNVVLVGRLTKKPELRKTQSNKSILNFTLAVNSGYKDENNNYITDFPNCIAWNQSAEYLSNYANKGDLIGIEGSVKTRNYESDKGKVYVTEIQCNKVCILGNKKNDNDLSKTNNDENDPNIYIETEDLPFY